MTLLERRLRLSTGLILAIYILLHLLNLGMGLISLDVMEAVREVIVRFWRSLPGGILLYSALITHFLLGLRSLFRRTTLKMPAWEAAQLSLGLCIIPLLAGHVAGTWGVRNLLDEEIDYEFVVGIIYADGWLTAKQTLLVVIVWLHVTVGLHFWLRIRPWYKRILPVVYPLIVLIPVCAFIAFFRIGYEIHDEQSGWVSEITTSGEPQPVSAEDPAAASITGFKNQILLVFYALLIGTLAARILRARLQQRTGGYKIFHSSGRVLTATRDRSLLESIRIHGVPHASVCGGRARCTTCRVRIGNGIENCLAATGVEKKALTRIGAPPNVRLACQTRATGDLHITPLIAPDIKPAKRIGGVQGSEQTVVAMFVDLRGSTQLGEKKLPYDVLFILNRFFSEISEVLNATSGHYAQFAGDGLMALFGLTRGLATGCRDALRAAVGMQRRIDAMNAGLISELDQPLRIGIGIHCGTAIVGTMGPPASPNYSAIGDHINAAARLESESKRFGCTLVVSKAAVDAAALDFGEFPQHNVHVRGKSTSLEVFAIDDMRALEVLLGEHRG